MIKKDITFSELGKKHFSKTTISATAGNVATNITPPAGYRKAVIRGVITLVNDATVANRYFLIQVLDSSSNIIEDIYQGVAQTASQNEKYSFGEANMADSSNGNLSDGNKNYFCIVRPIILDVGESLRIVIGTGQAGDSYSGYIIQESQQI